MPLAPSLFRPAALLFIIPSILHWPLSFSIPPSAPSLSPLYQENTTFLPHLITMTRSHKWNEKHHGGDGAAVVEREPDWFGSKAGHIDGDPKKTKKDGAGKANWGRGGDEAQDGDYNMAKPRRRSNSFVDHTKDFKSKFEVVEHEPVFEEHLHGPTPEDYEVAGLELDKQSSGSSIESIEEEVTGGHE